MLILVIENDLPRSFTRSPRFNTSTKTVIVLTLFGTFSPGPTQRIDYCFLPECGGDFARQVYKLHPKISIIASNAHIHHWWAIVVLDDIWTSTGNPVYILHV